MQQQPSTTPSDSTAQPQSTEESSATPGGTPSPAKTTNLWALTHPDLDAFEQHHYLLGQLHTAIRHAQAVGSPDIQLFDHNLIPHGMQLTGAISTASALQAAIQARNLNAVHDAFENATVEIGVKIPF